MPSKIKEGNMRRILSDETVISQIGQIELNVRTIYFAVVLGETSRSIKTDHIGCRVYIDGKLSLSGVSAHFFKTPINLSLKAPLAKVERLHQLQFKAFRMAFHQYIMTLRDLKAAVLYFDRVRGEGLVKLDLTGSVHDVYACNLDGRKTLYPETACVYLEEGQEVIVDRMAEITGRLTPTISQGVKFDADKWTSLDHDRLAFRVTDDGTTTGLFLNKKGA